MRYPARTQSDFSSKQQNSMVLPAPTPPNASPSSVEVTELSTPYTVPAPQNVLQGPSWILGRGGAAQYYANPSGSIEDLEVALPERYVPSCPPSIPQSRRSWIPASSRAPSVAPPSSRSIARTLSFVQSPAPLNVSDKYDFEDWNVTFEVEGTLYRVHKFFFKRESSVLANYIDHSPAGQPTPLLGVSCVEFEALLELMYSAAFEAEPMSVEKWILILHASHILSINKIYRLAIRKIDDLGGIAPVDKLIVAAKRDVEEWLIPACLALIEREDPLSIEEARKFFSLGERGVGMVTGMDIIPLLAQARERFRNIRSPKVRATAAGSIVEEIFKYPYSLSQMAIPSRAPSRAPSVIFNSPRPSL